MIKKIVTFFHSSKWQSFAKSADLIIKAVCCVVSGGIALYMFEQRFEYLSVSLMYDELYSAITASPNLPFSFVWNEILLKELNLPLFNVLLFGWVRVFPYTFFSMHLFSALLGASAVVLAFFLAPKRWNFLKKWIFVTLMAGASVFVWFDSVIRSYSLSVLCATVFTLLALRIIYRIMERQAPSKKTWIFFFIVGLLGSYSHYFCSGVFFITALVVFLYACYYKQSRAWAFWGTAVVFACWGGWLINIYSLLMQPPDAWWVNSKKFISASWGILQFLFGTRAIFTGILFGCVLATVSFISTYRKSLLKQVDVVLPFVQIVMLCGVVAVVSCKFNLWLDRYFLAVMPSILLLLADFLYHLYERHAILLVLWPVLLISWGQEWLTTDKVTEPTGLGQAFSYLVNERKADKVFVVVNRAGYPAAAVMPMLEYWVPEGKKLEIIPMTKENAHEAYESTPKIPVLMPLCSDMRLALATIDFGVEEDLSTLLEFHPAANSSVCVYTVHPFGPTKGAQPL